MKTKKKILPGLVLGIILFLAATPVMAGPPRIISVTMSQASPAYGDMVNIYVTACVNKYTNSYIDIAVSNSSTRIAPGSAGQVYIVSIAGVNVPRVNPNITGDEIGYLLSVSNPGAANNCTDCGGDTNSWTVTREYTVSIPDYSFFTSCGETGSLYLHVGLKDSYLGKGDWTGLPACQAYASSSWAQPVPPQGFTIAKSVEGTLQAAGDMLLYKVDYSYQNGAGFRIEENIPAGFTLVSYGPLTITGGSVSAGPPLTWNFPDMTGLPGQKSGTVWLLLQWDGIGAGPFTNTATGSWAGAGAVTSSVTSEVGDAAIKISKSQSADQLMLGNSITYYLSYEINGYRLRSFEAFDDASGAYSGGLAPPGWMSLPESGVYGTWTVEDPCSTGDNYITGSSTQYSGLLLDDGSGTDNSDQFCDGMIVSDFMIGASTTFPGADAQIIIRSNGQAAASAVSYGIVISIDNAPAPGYFMIMKCAGGCSFPAGGMPSIGAPVAGKWYRTRILVTNVGITGQTIRAKLWERGEPEPTAWDINYTDVTALSAVNTDCLGTGTYTDWRPGVNIMPGDYDDVLDSYDNFTSYGAASFVEAPYVHDDLVTGTTYAGCNGCSLSGGAPRWLIPSTTFQSGTLTWWAMGTTCGPISNRALINGGSDVFSNWVNADVICWSPTATPTVTPTPTFTRTRTASPTFTVTRTITVTPTVTYTSTQGSGVVCTPVSAVLCAAVDDMADIYINGSFVDQYAYVNWDATGVYPKCVSLTAGQIFSLVPSGNVIAVQNLNTNCCELWASWSLDVTCSSGGHAFVSSDSGDPISMFYDAAAVCPATTPTPNAGLQWTDPLYAQNSAWAAPSIVTGQKWGKRLWDPETGDLLPAMGYSATSPAGVSDCKQVFFRQGFGLAIDPTPLPPSFVISKSSTQVSNITGPGDLTFTVRVCNVGGGTFGNPVYVPDNWDSSQWLFNGPWGTVTDTIQGQIDQGSDGAQAVSWIFQAGVQGGTCYDVVYNLRSYVSTDNCLTWHNNSGIEYLSTPVAYSTVTLTNYCPPPPAWTLNKTDSDTTVSMGETHYFNLEFCNTGGAAPAGATLTVADDYSQTGTDDWQFQGPFYIGNPATGIDSISGSQSGKVITYVVTFESPGFTGCYTIPIQMYKTTNGSIQACTWNNIGSLQYLSTPEVVSTVEMQGDCSSPTYTPTRTVTPTPTFSATCTNTYTMTRTIVIGSATPSPTVTETALFTLTVTGTPPTKTITITPSMIFTETSTHTVTSGTFTATMTFTCTQTRTVTGTVTVTGETPAGTPTRTFTETLTPSLTFTNTCVCTSSYTVTQTLTVTPTLTGTVPSTMTPFFTPTVTITRTPACGAPVISVNLEYNPGNSDYVLVEITSSMTLTEPVSVRIVPHGTTDNKQEFTFTASLVSAAAPVYNVLYPKSTGLGDIDYVYVSGLDACGIPYTSNGSYTKQVLTLKNILLMKNIINNEKGERSRLMFTSYGGSKISIKIYNKMGVLIRRLYEEENVPAGRYEAVWDGRNDKGEYVVSGIYYMFIDAGSYKATEKIAVVH